MFGQRGLVKCVNNVFSTDPSLWPFQSLLIYFKGIILLSCECTFFLI